MQAWNSASQVNQITIEKISLVLHHYNSCLLNTLKEHDDAFTDAFMQYGKIYRWDFNFQSHYTLKQHLWHCLSRYLIRFWEEFATVVSHSWAVRIITCKSQQLRTFQSRVILKATYQQKDVHLLCSTVKMNHITSTIGKTHVKETIIQASVLFRVSWRK